MNDAVTKTLANAYKRYEKEKSTLNNVEFDPVTFLNEKEHSEIRLYYVACTRAKHILLNAKYLDEYDINFKLLSDEVDSDSFNEPSVTGSDFEF